MKAFICSDLHLDINFFPKERPVMFPSDADVFIIAGDSMNGFKPKLVDYLIELTQGKPTLMVIGNHECYGTSRAQVLENMMMKLAGSNISLLHNSSMVLNGIRFVGTDLWTDFNLFANASFAKAEAESLINDYRLIRINDGEKNRALEPEDTVKWHSEAVNFICHTLNDSAEPCVLITHHALSRKSIALEYMNNPLTPAFATDLEPIFEYTNQKPIMAINGHSHHYVHDRLDCGALLYSNPRGYDQNLLRRELVEITKTGCKVMR